VPCWLARSSRKGPRITLRSLDQESRGCTSYVQRSGRSLPEDDSGEPSEEQEVQGARQGRLRQDEEGRATEAEQQSDPATHQGRKPGVPNKTTQKLKEAILIAAELSGENGRGKNGLIGYLVMLSRKEKRSFAGLLGRVLPHTVNGGVEHVHRLLRSPEEIRAELTARGIPVPERLIDATKDDYHEVTAEELEAEAAEQAEASAKAEEERVERRRRNTDEDV
jgi:hypothetical protein